ncbi:MAG: bifunctional phosphoribosylaminoimidazolecarboxamide formyltransferase/IMP cyclohydrolase [Neisseriaceae bacterium]
MGVCVKRALISVSDKTGVVAFAQGLERLGIEILSTGGTAAILAQSGVSVIEVSDYTGFPEMLEGRVKTLHPKIHGGILARRDQIDHMDTLSVHGIGGIDLVCVNLYPFSQTITKEGCTIEDAIENIDIGGPAMLRSAAKNWKFVAAIVEAEDYQRILTELEEFSGNQLREGTSLYLAAKAFAHTASYDSKISEYLAPLVSENLQSKPLESLFPQKLIYQWQKVQELRYGENPHQKAALYRDLSVDKGSLVQSKQLQGKELSYNNLADSNAAWEAVNAFTQPACAIVKHANPCGLAIGESALEAYEKAYSTDQTSAFGGIIAFNCRVDEKVAQNILDKQFMEVLLAPLYSDEALRILAGKPKVRVLQLPLIQREEKIELKTISGGVLAQTVDYYPIAEQDLQIVSKRQPTKEMLSNLLFLWRVVQYVKSNAIVLGKCGQTYGIGAGQMSRVDSALIACRKAKEAGFNLNGIAAASDAFFPFRDGLDMLAERGIVAVVHPGGSIRDKEVIEAANEHHMVMAFTGVRHFRH